MASRHRFVPYRHSAYGVLAPEAGSGVELVALLIEQVERWDALKYSNRSHYQFQSKDSPAPFVIIEPILTLALDVLLFLLFLQVQGKNFYCLDK